MLPPPSGGRSRLLLLLCWLLLLRGGSGDVCVPPSLFLTFWCELVPADLINIVHGVHVVATRQRGQLQTHTDTAIGTDRQGQEAGGGDYAGMVCCCVCIWC